MHWVTLYFGYEVTRDVDCPVYFARYIDYSARCSDSASWSCSTSFSGHIPWFRTCPFEWHMLGYQPASIMNSLQLNAWNLREKYEWQGNGYTTFGGQADKVKWIVQRPAGTQYICSDSPEPVFGCVQL